MANNKQITAHQYSSSPSPSVKDNPSCLRPVASAVCRPPDNSPTGGAQLKCSCFLQQSKAVPPLFFPFALTSGILKFLYMFQGEGKKKEKDLLLHTSDWNEFGIPSINQPSIAADDDSF